MKYEYKLVDLNICSSGDPVEPWLKEGKQVEDTLNGLGLF